MILEKLPIFVRCSIVLVSHLAVCAKAQEPATDVIELRDLRAHIEALEVYPEFHIRAFHLVHPVTGRPPQYPEGDPAIEKDVGFAEARESSTYRDAASDVAALRARLVAAEEPIPRRCKAPRRAPSR